jgi:hypothetical protein
VTVELSHIKLINTPVKAEKTPENPDNNQEIG